MPKAKANPAHEVPALLDPESVAAIHGRPSQDAPVGTDELRNVLFDLCMCVTYAPVLQRALRPRNVAKRSGKVHMVSDVLKISMDGVMLKCELGELVVIQSLKTSSDFPASLQETTHGLSSVNHAE